MNKITRKRPETISLVAKLYQTTGIIPFGYRKGYKKSYKIFKRSVKRYLKKYKLKNEVSSYIEFTKKFIQELVENERPTEFLEEKL